MSVIFYLVYKPVQGSDLENRQPEGGAPVRLCRVQGACAPSIEIVCTNPRGTLVQANNL